jgi:hypothetical protein
MPSPRVIEFAAYVRTSTDDQQSPEDSKRWQLDTARRLITPAGGVIVAVYHDIDVTPASCRGLVGPSRPDCWLTRPGPGAPGPLSSSLSRNAPSPAGSSNWCSRN